ncbi:hypothetical protein IQ266_05800 [filamentous cyanobacterium LEGE 11480]|uniref:Uncharacterized protein n=1 Tax=Romeriopsis navalis LEGE 11480 TaxID=2777977 RepID=A0A928VNS4_9CYAN|nr:hypothetical protein [Romeriopsis navalis]MBE9029274.1 hypothetical protein [Romeriopsis navalis LEGE 11480]
MPEPVQASENSVGKSQRPTPPELIQAVSLEQLEPPDASPTGSQKSPKSNAGHSRWWSTDEAPDADEAVFQLVSLDRFTADRQSPRSAWWSTASGTMPNWLLALSWLGLGLPAVLLSLYTLTQAFLGESDSASVGAETSDFLFGLVIATIVNLSSLVLFSILGRETARKLRSKRRRKYSR